MNWNSQFKTLFLKNHNLLFTTTRCAQLFNHLIFYMHLSLNRLGTIVDVTVLNHQRHTDRRNTFFRMTWMGHMEQKDLQRTLKHGIVLYVMLGLLVIPSGICSQGHHIVPVIDILLPEAMAPSVPRLSLDLIGNMPLHAFEDNLQPATLPPPAVLTAGGEDRKEPSEAPPFYEHILQASQTYEVDVDLIRAIIFAESNYNPQAVSHRGARGLMQLMPRTAKALGVKDSFDPAMNIDGGVRYFKQLLNRFSGDVRLALAAYNAGSRYVHKYGGIPPFGATKRYIKKVLHYHNRFKAESASSQAVNPAV